MSGLNGGQDELRRGRLDRLAGRTPAPAGPQVMPWTGPEWQARLNAEHPQTVALVNMLAGQVEGLRANVRIAIGDSPITPAEKEQIRKAYEEAKKEIDPPLTKEELGQ